ncbi:hypothetical protein GLYMA_02G250550v4 [Glycine max]|nr:hypothetical protein GLYMA_02G250550v4 [Glycine max]KAH1061986.1 hypothetical protein GYH30_005144 [Glycine max]
MKWSILIIALALSFQQEINSIDTHFFRYYSHRKPHNPSIFNVLIPLLKEWG